MTIWACCSCDIPSYRPIAEMVEMLDTLEEAGDADSAIGLYEGMSQEQQAQIVTARHAPPVCSVCGAEAPGLLCDGVVGAGTCDKPLCKDCSTSQIFMACTRGGAGPKSTLKTIVRNAPTLEKKDLNSFFCLLPFCGLSE